MFTHIHNVIYKTTTTCCCRYLLFLLLNGLTLHAWAQAPIISYKTPQTYAANITIMPLAPANLGGAVPANAYGQVSIFAGNGAAGANDGTGAAASFNTTRDLAIDMFNNIYVADKANNKIRKITPQGVVTTVAGSGATGAVNANGANASFTSPNGLTVDAAGNIYVADSGNNLIRKILPNGAVITFAGSGAAGANDGTTFASFNFPNDVVTDNAGNVYVSDYVSEEIRKITSAGAVSTMAGYPVIGDVDGTGPAARFYNPGGITIDASGNIYVTDVGNDLIRKITPDSVVTTLAGTGSKGAMNANGTAASFSYPSNITFDQQGNMYVSDTFNSLIRKIDVAGNVTTLAGVAGVTGLQNGDRLSATFNQPFGIVADKLGNLYVSDAGNYVIRKIPLTGYAIDKALSAGLTFDPTTGIISGTPTVAAPATNYTVTAYNTSGSSSTVVNISVKAAIVPATAAPHISYQTPKVYPINTNITPLAPANTGGAVPATIYGQVSTFAGNTAGNTNGTGTTAVFNNPTRLAEDANGNLFVADRDNDLIRKITPDGVVTTFASGFNQPNGPTVNTDGSLYVADAASNSIKVVISGEGIIFAGGRQSSVNGPGALAGFYYPYSLTHDAAGNLYVADSHNNLIRKITPAAIVSTLAGSGNAGFANGTGISASFNSPGAVNIDATGNVYVADGSNNMIRKITPAGVVTTIAGNGAAGASNGTAPSSTFNTPDGVAVDAIGNVYVADLGNNLIRKIDISGTVTTLAGSGDASSNNGVGILAGFNRPNDVQVDPGGFLYVTDYGNEQIRKVIITGYAIDKPLPTGLTFDATTGIISGTPTVISPATNYTVTAYNTVGSSSTVVNIAVDANNPIVFPPIPDKTICDASFSLTATGGSGTYTYTSSNPAVATISGNVVTIVGPGTTTITASEGTSTQTQILTVDSPITPTIKMDQGYFTSCQGLSLPYTVTITNGGINPMYQWKVNGIDAGTNSPSFTTTDLNTGDVVSCTLTNTSDCTTGPVTVTNPAITVLQYVTPTIAIQASTTGPIADNTPVTFTSTITNGGTSPIYQWMVNNINEGTNSPAFTYSCFKDGDVVTCELTNQGGECLTALYVYSNLITISVSDPNPTVTISASANNILGGTPVIFTAVINVTNVATYQWMVNGKDAGTNSPDFTSSTLINGDKVNCTIIESGGCNVSAESNQVVMAVSPPPSVTIPNAFTPNGDGINDLWDIAALAYYQNCTVDIYNRYGGLVYHSKGYSKAWDGTYNGNRLPVATYYYVIDLGDKSPKLSGYVTLIR